MKKNQTIRQALEVLEKEMAVLSLSELSRISGGTDPLPSGYCTFNNISFIATQMGVSVSAQNVLGNYVNCYDDNGFSWDSNHDVTGVQTGVGSDMEDFYTSIFDTQACSGSSAIRSALAANQLVSISSKGTDGHAYTITSWDGNRNMFIFRDTTTNTNIEVEDNLTNMGQFTNATAITGIKIGTNAGTQGDWWTSDSLTMVQDPSTIVTGGSGQ